MMPMRPFLSALIVAGALCVAPGVRAEDPAADSVPLHPGLCAPYFNGASLWVIAHDDEMPGSEPEVSHLCYEAAGGDKELLDIEGGHFGLLYDRSPLFDTVSAAQADFLVRRLGG